LLGFIACDASPPTPEQDRAAIRETFARYRQAVVDEDGQALVDLLSQQTLSYYERMRDLCLGADETTLRAEALMTQVQVLSLRIRMKPEELEGMSGADLIRHSVAEGWLRNPAAADSDIGEIQLDGDRAEATHLVSGKDGGSKLYFAREPAGWRIDRHRSMLDGEERLATLFERGLSKDELIDDLLRASTGRRFTRDLLEPPRPSDSAS
jgi:hypothetical protein